MPSTLSFATDTVNAEEKSRVLKLECKRLKAIADGYISSKGSPEWLKARAEWAAAKEELEIFLEEHRVQQIVNTFNEEFPPEKREGNCPICLERLPDSGVSLLLCCGKAICLRCSTPENVIKLDNKCPFCNADFPDRGSKKKKIAALHLCADNKDSAWAQFELAVLYDGDDFAKSAFYYHKAAKNGHTIAMHNLAQRYLQRHNPAIPYSCQEAFRLFKLAAEKGYPDSQLHLALAYLSNGSFAGEINPAEAVRWCTIAAAQGNCQAYRKFYSLFSSENPLPGLVTSKLRAAYWIRKAAFQNTSALAQYSYATILLAIASDTFGNPDISGYSVIPKVLFWLQRAKVTAQKGKDQPPAPDAQLQQVQQQQNEALLDGTNHLLSCLRERASSQCAYCKKTEGPSVALQRCSQCQAAYFCGRSCQVKCWKQGHKADCTSLQDEKKQLSTMMP